MPKPNVVFFVPDSYRGDVLGHMGNAGALTPALDRLVADGGAVSYRNAFAQNPVCTPSRCSFMTGWYPHVHGHRSMRNMLKPHEPHLLRVLGREGYRTWWGGKNDLVRAAAKEDYLAHCDEKFEDSGGRFREASDHGYRMPPPLGEDDPRHGAFYRGVCRKDGEGKGYVDGDEVVVRGAIDRIRNTPPEQPFFLYLPLSKPHPAYMAEGEFYDAIDPETLPPRIPAPEGDAGLPPVLADMRREFESGRITEEMWRDAKRIYYAMCAKTDALLGMLVDSLQEEGLYENTWIFFFSDHGDFTGDYGLPEKTHATLQDALLRVPLVIKPPKGVTAEPGVRDELVELVDLTATLYDCMGIDPGYACQGVSLRDSLAGTDAEPHEAVFAEVGARRGEESFVNTQVLGMPPRSFYARQSRAAIPRHRAGSHAVSCRTKRYKYVRRRYSGHHELYDLAEDPGETRNLSGEADHAEAERAMEARLLDYFLHTSDVLPHELDPR